jgi:hypothetical protein
MLRRTPRRVSALNVEGGTIWIADAHREDGKRFIVRADDQLTAFVELQRAIHEFAERRRKRNNTGIESVYGIRLGHLFFNFPKK